MQNGVGQVVDREGGAFRQGFLIGWGGCSLAPTRHWMEDQGFPGEGHFLLFSGSRVEKSTNNFFFFFFFCKFK